MTDHLFKRIEGLAEDDPARRGFAELRPLLRVWERNREGILGRNGLESIHREWAIETGLLEGVYDFDRGVTQALIEDGIVADAIERVGRKSPREAQSAVDLINAQKEVLEGLFAYVKGEWPISAHYIRQLHAELTRPQEFFHPVDAEGNTLSRKLVHGQYKRLPNDVIRGDGSRFQFCPPELVEEQMEQLIANYSELESQELPPETLSAWLHHRFVLVHPFEDGNGRVARALASLVMIKAGYLPVLIRKAGRSDYLAALERADAGELRPLVMLIGRRQKEDIVRVISAKPTRTIAESLVNTVANLKREEVYQESKAERLMEGLRRKTQEILKATISKLNDALLEVSPSGKKYQGAEQFIPHKHPSSGKHNVSAEEIAELLGYTAHTARSCYHRFWITTNESYELVIHTHALSEDEEGVRMVSAFSLFGSRGDGMKVLLGPVGNDYFQFNDEEREDEVQRRYTAWLEPVLDAAISQWANLHGPMLSSEGEGEDH